MIRKCDHCGTEIDLHEVEPGMSHVDCPKCGEYLMSEIEHQAICHAEKIGVYEYAVNEDGWMEYWSFFPGEGFRFIQHNLNTGEEKRDGFIPWDKNEGMPIPMFLREWNPEGPLNWKTHYNYNVG